MHELPEHVRPFLEPDFYPHPVGHIEMLQTHISWVFLTGKFAYKLKKPVNFGFLDFSTQEKRRYYCTEELRLNRRLAPELYLDVLPVSQKRDSFCLGDETNVVDYCLKMRQFGQQDLLSRRLEHGNFEAAWMDRIATDIAAFHVSVTAEASTKQGSPDQLAAHIRDNLDIAGRHQGEVIDSAQLGRLRAFAEDELRRFHNPLLRRQREGFVRPCHGDLHLGNLTLWQGKPLAFDCIEFNEEYRTIDTMNDVAFLVMDCEARGRPDLGMRFLSRYLEASGDYGGLELLPLYLFYRATVRGKVACLSAGNTSLAASERAGKFTEAHHYFNLAASYAAPLSPKLIMIGGLSGSGKSHLALIGCGIERAVVIRSDATRKRIAGEHAGLPLYGEAMHRLTYEAMLAAAVTALKAGWPVILDATFLGRSQRDAVRKLAAEAEVPLTLYWLDTSSDELRLRVQARSAVGRDISDADLDVLEGQLANYRRPTETGITFLSGSDRWPDG